MQKHFLKKGFLAFALAFTLALPVFSTAQAAGGLLIMPIRVMFKDRDRTGNVTLVNTGADDAMFKVVTQSQKQREDGSYEIMKEAFDPAADLAPMLVYSPRQITLAGGGKQRIRLSLRRPPELADGEYRTHMLMTNYGKTDAVSSRKAPAGKLAIQLGMNVGYSLPVILRQGAYDTAVSIDDVQFIPSDGKKDSKPQLKVTMTRSGKFSSIGKITVLWTPPGGAEENAGIANNINIFPEVTRRVATFPLLNENVRGGSVRLIYEGDGPDKGVVFDDKSFPIGG